MGKGDDTGEDDEHQPLLGSQSSFTVRRALGTVVIAVHGEIEFDDWSRIDGVLNDIIGAQGNLDVVVDFCEVAYLEPAAIPLIVHAARQARSHGGRLRLADRACRECLPAGPTEHGSRA
ncbi:MAG: STAS domain-containing protein [Actinomycetota bacterium]|nr:STAS domain-containing protein [Actinomycetota bacterium]